MKRLIPSGLVLTLLLAACNTTSPAPIQHHLNPLGVINLVVGEGAGIEKQTLNLPSNFIQMQATGTKYLDVGGYRYISTTYRVRNAQANGTAYPGSKTNITLLAYESASSLRNTSIRSLKKADGTAALSSLALQVFPTHGTTDTPTSPSLASGQESLQLYADSEMTPLESNAALTSVGVLNVFPYGWVVRNTAGGRTLPGNPASGDFAGTVTVGLKIPLQNPVSNTPRTVAVQMVVAEDTITRVTESLEEQSWGNSGVGARVTTAGASEVTVVSGSTYTGSPKRTVCQVPIARAPNLTHMVNRRPGVEQVTPALQTPSSSGAYISALFDCIDVAGPTLSAATPENELVIQASQTGKRLAAFNTFNSGIFEQVGKEWTYSPSGGAGFKPGEKVEVTVRHATGLIRPFVHQYLVGSLPEGATGFNGPSNATVGTGYAYALDTGDLDGDGDLDAVMADRINNNLHIAMGNGNGTFQASTTLSLGGTSSDVTLADLNNDGKLDIIAGSNDTLSLLVFPGNGNGTFQTANLKTTGTYVWALDTGDINGDGNQDVVATTYLMDTALVFIGNGDGTLQNPTSYATGNDPHDIALADLNRDGRLDLITANIADSTLSVFRGNGDGTFQTQQIVNTGTGPSSLALGDLNQDGNLDVAAAFNAGHAVGVHFGNGDLTLQAVQTYSVAGTEPYPFRVTLGDFNGDTFLDLASANTGNTSVSVFQNNTDGTLGAENKITVGAAPAGIDAGDLNGDGKLDLMATSFVNTAHAVLLKK